MTQSKLIGWLYTDAWGSHFTEDKREWYDAVGVETVTPLYGTEDAVNLVRDALRYRELRAMTWHSSDICVVVNPKENVKLGSDCPSGDRLDELLDKRLSK